MLDRILSALVALSLAFLVWMYARSRDQEILDNVAVPVQITLARSQSELYSLEVPDPCEVPVSFTGPPSRIKELRNLLQRGELTVQVTLAVPEERQRESRYLETVRVQPTDIHCPPGVTPMVVEGRNRIPATLHRLVERTLPVQLDTAGEDRVGPFTLEPATVQVRGPAEILDRIRAIPTQPYLLPARPELAGAAQSVSVGPVPLVQDIEGWPIRVTPPAVTLRLTLQPRKKIYELDCPVHFLCPANLPWEPRFTGDGRDGKIVLKVEGPAGDEPPAVLAFIDLTRRRFEQGLHEEPLRLQLPKEFQALSGTPHLVPFRLDPPGLSPQPTLTGSTEP